MRVDLFLRLWLNPASRFRGWRHQWDGQEFHLEIHRARSSHFRKEARRWDSEHIRQAHTKPVCGRDMAWTQVFCPKCHNLCQLHDPSLLGHSSDKPLTEVGLTSTVQVLCYTRRRGGIFTTPRFRRLISLLKMIFFFTYFEKL